MNSPAENPNQNCLKGKRCPKCGSYGPFNVIAVSTFKLSDDGTESHDEVEFEEESQAWCTKCDWEGAWKTFDDRASQKTKVEYSCANCQWNTTDSDEIGPLSEVHHLWERLDSGGPVPEGACPDCGSFVYKEELKLVLTSLNGKVHGIAEVSALSDIEFQEAIQHALQKGLILTLAQSASVIIGKEKLLAWIQESGESDA